MPPGCQKSWGLVAKYGRLKLSGSSKAQTLGHSAGHVGVARKVAIDLERKGIDGQQCQPAVGGLPAAEEVVDDQRQVVGHDDLFKQAPEEDQVCALVQLGNEQDLAPNYQLLGTIARNRGRPDDAEQWYRKALVITEDLGDQKTTVSTYNLLGTLARMRYRLDDAEEWYRKALAISTERGDLSAMAAASGQLGLVAEDRGQFGLALEWLVRSVSLFDEFPHPSAMPGPIHLARLAARLGMEALEECWRKVTGNSLPPPVRHYVESDTNK